MEMISESNVASSTELNTGLTTNLKSGATANSKTDLTADSNTGFSTDMNTSLTTDSNMGSTTNFNVESTTDTDPSVKAEDLEHEQKESCSVTAGQLNKECVSSTTDEDWSLIHEVALDPNIDSTTDTGSSFKAADLEHKQKESFPITSDQLNEECVSSTTDEDWSLIPEVQHVEEVQYIEESYDCDAVSSASDSQKQDETPSEPPVAISCGNVLHESKPGKDELYGQLNSQLQEHNKSKPGTDGPYGQMNLQLQEHNKSSEHIYPTSGNNSNAPELSSSLPDHSKQDQQYAESILRQRLGSLYPKLPCLPEQATQPPYSSSSLQTKIVNEGTETVNRFEESRVFKSILGWDFEKSKFFNLSWAHIFAGILIFILVIYILISLFWTRSVSHVEKKNELKLIFPGQNERFWKTVKVSASSIFVEDKFKRPAILLLTSSAAHASLTLCLAKNITASIQSSLGFSSPSPIVDITHFSNMDPADQKIELDSRIQAAFSTVKSKTLIIDNLQLLEPSAALLFYNYCDSDNAEFKDVMILFTLYIEDYLFSSDQMEINSQQVEKYLQDLWSKSLVMDKVMPLLSRVANNIAIVSDKDKLSVNSLC